jgi:hypothetical protein
MMVLKFLALTLIPIAVVGLGLGCTDGGKSQDTSAPEMFAASDRCVMCHNALHDEADRDVSIGTAWEPTMMANAARDPYFQAKVSTEIVSNPGLAETIEDTCAICHIPMARTQLVADGLPGTLFEDGEYNPSPELHKLAMDGVSCTLCHQILDERLGAEESFSGGYVIDTHTESPDRGNYGRWFDVEQESMEVMATSSGFTPVGGEHVTRAALCATCHTLYTPTVDGNGEMIGEFPEQVAFLEWRHGAFGDGEGEDRPCQSCHMPEATGDVIIGLGGSSPTARSPFAEHHFVGGNQLIMGMLDIHRDALEVKAPAESFEAAFDRVTNQLEQNAAEMTIVTAEQVANEVSVQVRVENKAGHKLPTGFPSRRLWIHLTVSDADQAVVFESGKPNSDGHITGGDTDADPTTFEVHHREITEADQVQIYEPVMTNSDGQVTFTVLRAAAYIKDNRIPPAGFDKATAGSDFAVVGEALDDADFVGGSDLVDYTVDVTGHTGPFSVTARLLYQSVSFPFAEDMRSHETAEATRFIGYLDSADQTPVVVASATAEVL